MIAKSKSDLIQDILEGFVIYKKYFQIFFSEATYVILHFMSGVSNALEAFEDVFFCMKIRVPKVEIFVIYSKMFF